MTKKHVFSLSTKWSFRFFQALFLIIIIISCNHTEEASANNKALWIEDAFQSITNGTVYPKIKAIAWWHENFDNSYLRVASL